MPKKLTGNKTQRISIGDTEDCYLLVNFDWEVTKHPTAKEFCHGEHEINQDEVNHDIKLVTLCILGGANFEIKPNHLNAKQKSAIENLLSIYD